MRRREVVFAPEAKEGLLRLYDWIADAAGSQTAIAYIEKIESRCLNLDLASERGKLRDDIRPGLRIIGFQRRVTIAFTVDGESVTIPRLLYAGQDWERVLS